MAADPAQIRVEQALFVRIGEAKNLPSKDLLTGKSDPYVVLSGFGTGSNIRTKTVWGNLNPFFGEEHEVELGPSFEELLVEVWDANKHGADDFIGRCAVSLDSLQRTSDERAVDQWFPLSPNERGHELVSGELLCALEYTPPDPSGQNGQFVITVMRGTGMAAKDANGLSDPYVKIKNGGVKKKTSVKPKTLDPEYGETFAFDITVDSPDEMFVSVWDKDKLSRNDFMGGFVLYLSELEPNHPYEQWFKLLDMSDLVSEDAGGEDGDSSLSAPSAGSIRLKLRYSYEEILPLEHYEDFQELLMEDGAYTVVMAMAETGVDRNEFARHLVRAFESEGYDCTLELLQYLNRVEVENTPNTGVLFRGNSIATKANDMYMKLVGMPFLQDTIGTQIQAIYNMKESVEVDPTRVDSEGEVEANWPRLRAVCQVMCDNIFSSHDTCPTVLRLVFREIQEAVVDKWPDDDDAKYIAVSGFLFLRFFCPAILGPKLFDLMGDHPEQGAARALTLIAKTLQNTANLVGFGQKEAWMAPMNDLINENMPRLKAFIDALGEEPDDFHDAGAQLLDKEREMHRVLDLCRHHRDELEAANRETPREELDQLFDVMDAIAVIEEGATRPEVKRVMTRGRRSQSNSTVGQKSNPPPISMDAIAEAVGELGEDEPAATTSTGASGGAADAGGSGGGGGDEGGDERRENMRKLLEIQANLSKCDIKKSLAHPQRVFVREGIMSKKSKKKVQERTFFLFNDMLLYGEVKRGKSTVNFKGMIMIDMLVVVDPASAHPTESGGFSFDVINLSKKKVITINCVSAEDRDNWMDDICTLTASARPDLSEVQAECDRIYGAAVVEYVARLPAAGATSTS